jgi:hypothetical protein
VNVSEDNSKAVLIKQKMQTKKNPGTSPEFLVMI